MGIERPRLPDPKPPFMVRDRFRIAADLFPLGAEYNGQMESAHFVADSEWDASIAEKLDILATRAERASCVATGDPIGLAEAIWRTFGLLATDEPGIAELRQDGVDLHRLGLSLRFVDDASRIEPAVSRRDPTPLGARVADWLNVRTGVNRLAEALALTCQEDIVIMHGGPDGPDTAELLQVCFPSGWDPREKLATGFHAIHTPIADNARLLGSSANVMRALLTKGPYLRFSWGVTLDRRRDAHPELPRPDLSEAEWSEPDLVANRTYLRMERQTTSPMPDLHRGLFTIRIYVDPLVRRLTEQPELRSRLANLLGSTAPDVQAYKGIARLTPPLLAWLASSDEGHGEPIASGR